MSWCGMDGGGVWFVADNRALRLVELLFCCGLEFGRNGKEWWLVDCGGYLGGGWGWGKEGH